MILTIKNCQKQMVETDGEVEVIDVKLNNRKTKKLVKINLKIMIIYKINFNVKKNI